MLIAVISDTHGNLPVSVARILPQADEIWHLGDFCDLSIVGTLQALGPPVYAVLGNNDWSLDFPRHLILERSGRKFFLIHIPPMNPGGADFLLHGHTHVPRDERIGATRVFNPGAVGRADKGAPASWAWLRIETDGTVAWEIVPV